LLKRRKGILNIKNIVACTSQGSRIMLGVSKRVDLQLQMDVD